MEGAQKIVEQRIMKAAQMIEKRVDSEIQKLDNITDDDLDSLRKKRLSEMKELAKKRDGWLTAGHGRYYEVAGERDFFDECKRSDSVVCHFYRDVTMRCQIFDKHLYAIAPDHLECKFVKINAEKCPFLTQRLQIYVIPTLLIIKEENVKDFIVGFDELGGHDNFSTEMLLWRLAQADVVNYNGDTRTPPDGPTGEPVKQKNLLKQGYGSKKKALKNIRGNAGDDSSDDNDWD